MTAITTGGRPLTVGVPRERKADEHRVAITPDGVAELAHHGVSVLVEAGAGEGAAIPDDAFRAAGAEIVADAADADAVGRAHGAVFGDI
ncbi:MAG: hypothetical protein ACKOOG_11575, partial [Actinomycetota bacterium]